VRFFPYDVTADGRFLMLTRAADATTAASPVTVAELAGPASTDSRRLPRHHRLDIMASLI